MNDNYIHDITLNASFNEKNIINFLKHAYKNGCIFFHYDTYEHLSIKECLNAIYQTNSCDANAIILKHLDTSAVLSFLLTEENFSYILYGYNELWEKKFYNFSMQNGLCTYENMIDNARYMRLMLTLSERFSLKSCSITNEYSDIDSFKHYKNSLILSIATSTINDPKEIITRILINASENKIQLCNLENSLLKNCIQNFDNTELEFASYGTYSCYALWKDILAQLTINTNNIILIPLDVNTKTPLFNTSTFDLRQYTKMLLLLCENFGILEMYCYTENEE